MKNLTLLPFVFLSISGCDTKVSQNDYFCEVPPEVAGGTAMSCVHNRAYMAYDADAPIDVIASVVAQKCDIKVEEDVRRQIYESTGEIYNREPSDKQQYLQLMQEYEEKVLKEAVRRVREARVGKCDKPPI